MSLVIPARFYFSQALPPETVLNIGDVRDLQQSLLPSEAGELQRLSPRRALTFVAGRNIVRQALLELDDDAAKFPINRSSWGGPQWPENIVGSISHKRNIVVAIVGFEDSYQSLGVDLETTEELTEKVWSTFTTEREISSLAGSGLPVGVCSNVIFSLKEAIFKALSPILRDNIPEISSASINIEVDKNQYLARFDVGSVKCYAKALLRGDVILSTAWCKRQ